MAIDNYKPTLWVDSIIRNFHQANFAGIITTPPVEKKGEKVVFNRLSPGAWKDYTNGQKIEWSTVATTKVEMGFPYQKYFAFMVDDADACQLANKVLDTVTQEQSDVLGEEVSQELVSFIVSKVPPKNAIGATAGTILGTATVGTASSVLDGKSLVIRVDSGNATSIAIASGDTLDSIITKINSTYKTNIASNSGGKLVLTSAIVGTNSNITIDSTSNADVLTYLGLTSGSSNSGVIDAILIDKTNAYDNLVDLNTLANNLKVPVTNRYFIINPNYLALLAKDSRFTLQYSILENGVVDGATINGTQLICKADNPSDKVVLTHPSGTGFAMQLDGSPEAVRLVDYIGDGVRGLVKYGYTQLRPESSCVSYVRYK